MFILTVSKKIRGGGVNNGVNGGIVIDAGVDTPL